MNNAYALFIFIEYFFQFRYQELVFRMSQRAYSEEFFAQTVEAAAVSNRNSFFYKFAINIGCVKVAAQNLAQYEISAAWIYLEVSEP